MLAALAESCRPLLADQSAFDRRFLAVLAAMLPVGHPLAGRADVAVQMLYVVLRAVVSGRAPEITEAECVAWGERLAAAGLPEDSYGLVGFAASRAARDAAGERWTSQVGSQWAAVHLWVVEHFLLGARRAVGPGAVSPGTPDPRDPRDPRG